MHLLCHAQQVMPCPAPVAFDWVVDPARFPALFTGYGLIPAVLRVTLEAPLAVGSLRRIDNSDGSVLSEQVTVLERPHRHAYLLGGFKAPFSWLVKQGEADWTISELALGSQVRWQYRFVLTGFWVYPMAALLLHFFMARAMQRCLDNMARALAVDAAAESA